MRLSKILFRLVDFVYYPFQNYKRVKGLNIEKDIVYNEHHPRCKFDIYYKPTQEKLPVIINLHGGGYSAGNKNYRKSIAMLFADNGWFVVNMNYRLGKDNPFPAAIEDLINAINHVATLEEKYNLDLSKLVVTGDSAGAHFSASLLAAIHDEECRKNIEVPMPKIIPFAWIGFSGPYDMYEVSKTKLAPPVVRSTIKELTGINFKKDYSDWDEYKYNKEVSPINYVNDKWPQTMLVYAKKDFFCAGHGELMEEKLKNHGVNVTSFSTNTASDNHCFHLIFYKKASKEALKKVIEFLDEIKK